jgi:outer membrane protein assembly factor BamB
VTTLTSSRASSSYDSLVTFTAQVTAASKTPAGSVTFTDVSNGSVLATEKLGNGTASFTTAALAPGARMIVAHYGGSSTYAASTSATVDIAVAAAGSDAAAYQIDAQHDGDQSRGRLQASSLTQKWHIDLIGGYVSYPVIARGQIFVTSGNGGGSTIWLYALNAATGQTEWSAVVGSTPNYVTLAYDGRDIFAFTPGGSLTAYRASTGHELWADQLSDNAAWDAPPTAYDGVVYVGTSGVGGIVYAVSEADGRIRWAQPVMNGDQSSPAVDDSGVYVSYDGQQDYRFRLSGKLVWHYAPSGEGGGGSTPALHEGSVYARGDPTFDSSVILSATSGTVTGTFASGYTPAFAGRSMYTVNSGDLVASAASGSPTRWTFAGQNIDTAPAVNNGVVYALSTSGTVFGVSVTSGAKVWTGSVGQATNGPDLSGIAIGGGLLVVPAGSTLTAFGN